MTNRDLHIAILLALLVILGMVGVVMMWQVGMAIAEKGRWDCLLYGPWCVLMD